MNMFEVLLNKPQIGELILGDKVGGDKVGQDKMTTEVKGHVKHLAAGKDIEQHSTGSEGGGEKETGGSS